MAARVGGWGGRGGGAAAAGTAGMGRGDAAAVAGGCVLPLPPAPFLFPRPSLPTDLHAVNGAKSGIPLAPHRPRHPRRAPPSARPTAGTVSRGGGWYGHRCGGAGGWPGRTLGWLCGGAAGGDARAAVHRVGWSRHGGAGAGRLHLLLCSGRGGVTAGSRGCTGRPRCPPLAAPSLRHASAHAKSFGGGGRVGGGWSGCFSGTGAARRAELAGCAVAVGAVVGPALPCGF